MFDHSFVIVDVGAVRALEFKDELEAAELMQDRDFSWEYRQAQYNNDGFSAVTPRQVKFSFSEANLVTFYKLKWTK